MREQFKTTEDFIKWIGKNGKVVGQDVYMVERVPKDAETHCQKCGKAHTWAVGDLGFFDDEIEFVVDVFDAAETVFKLTKPEVAKDFRIHFFKGSTN